MSIEIKSNQETNSKGEPTPNGFIHESEEDRLLRDIQRPDLEKLQLFTQMIRRNRLLKQFQIKDNGHIG